MPLTVDPSNQLRMECSHADLLSPQLPSTRTARSRRGSCCVWRTRGKRATETVAISVDGPQLGDCEVSASQFLPLGLFSGVDTEAGQASA